MVGHRLVLQSVDNSCLPVLQVAKGGRGVGELELRSMAKLLQSLPQYRWARRLAGGRSAGATVLRVEGNTSL